MVVKPSSLVLLLVWCGRHETVLGFFRSAGGFMLPSNRVKCGSMQLQLQHCSPKPSHAVGLINLGSTCYLNSALQALYHIDTFRSAVLGTEYEKDSFGDELKLLFRGMRDSSMPLNSIRLHRHLKAPIGVQQDAHEYLLKILELVGDHVASTPLALPSSSFEGELVISENGRRLTDTFRDLLIPMNSNSSHSLQECLNEYFDTSQGRETFISKFPDVLVVTLQRFSYNSVEGNVEKIGSYVSFNETLSLSQYALPSGRGSCEYNLKSVIVHKGNADDGHYIAFAKVPGASSAWLRCDDENITPLSSFLGDVGPESFGVCNDELKESHVRERSTTDSTTHFLMNHQLPRENFSTAYVLFFERRL